MLALDIQNITKKYKNGVTALNDLNFQVKAGDIFSLLGPNGAGKSSLINILTTYYRPSSGKVLILEKDLCENPAWIRSQIACVAQQMSIDDHLSMKENMLFQSRMYKVEASEAKKRIDHLIQSFELSEYLKRPTSSYSGGVKRRLDIAMNMVSKPKILFLDEPTVGMDVQSRMAMWQMLKKIRDEYGTTIFLTTHYLQEADELSDAICIMKKGHKLAQGTPQELRNYTRQNMLKVSFNSILEGKNQLEKIKENKLITAVNVKDNTLLLNVSDSNQDFHSINKYLLDNAIPFSGIEILEPSLEDVFLSLTGNAKNGGDL